MDNLPILKTKDCWLWQGTITNNGYGVICRKGISQVAHRYIFKLMGGVIPDNYQLDHLCGVKNCVRPEHLQPVTRLENMQRYYAKLNGKCLKGLHQLSGNNLIIQTYKGKTQRRCRECKKAYYRKS